MRIDMHESTIEQGAVRVPLATVSAILGSSLGGSWGTARAFETSPDGSLQRVEHSGSRSPILPQPQASALASQIVAAPAFIEAAKQSAVERVRSWRTSREAGGFEYAGNRFDSDQLSAMRIMGAAQMAMAQPTYSIVWTTQDNVSVALDRAGMLALFAALGAHASTVHDAATAAKASIRAATSLAQVEAALATLS